MDLVVDLPMINKKGTTMIKRFEVKNFKGFKDKLVFDFSSRGYDFHEDLIRHAIVNKAVIYGKNGIGKSSLGIALFDITSHLTDNERFNPVYLENYRNLDSIENPVEFKYIFLLDGDVIVYEYMKLDVSFLISEKLSINDQEVLYYNYFTKDNNHIDSTIKGSLNIELVDNQLSILKFIYRNTPQNTYPPLTKMIQFCENMLWYRSLSDGNVYAGFQNGRSLLEEILYENGKREEFENFLSEYGEEYNLNFESVNGAHKLFAYFDNGSSKAPFDSIASTGTKALYLFFTWRIKAFNKLSFLFIDEFDAFLHYEAAASLVKLLNSESKFQSVLTTHNTYLMNNKITRPDCCYIMTKNKLTCLSDCTDKEISEAHNLEKMYINGAFLNE